MYRIFLFLVLLISFQYDVLAACDTDRFGVVYCGRGNCAQDKAGNIFCSKYLFGDALLDKYGSVVCGKGECLLSRKFDDAFCSAIESGGADRNLSGEIKCYGGCEKASALMCENEQGR